MYFAVRAFFEERPIGNWKREFADIARDYKQTVESLDPVAEKSRSRVNLAVAQSVN